MTALKSANKELKGMMKTVKIQDIDVRFLYELSCVCFLDDIFFYLYWIIYLTEFTR